MIFLEESARPAYTAGVAARPAVFIDGHVSVLNQEAYKGNYQNIMSSNANNPKPNIHQYFEISYPTPLGPKYGGCNRFALSEYYPLD